MDNRPQQAVEKRSKWRKVEAFGLLFVAIFWLVIYLAFVIFMTIGAKRVGKPEKQTSYSSHHLFAVGNSTGKQLSPHDEFERFGRHVG